MGLYVILIWILKMINYKLKDFLEYHEKTSLD